MDYQGLSMVIGSVLTPAAVVLVGWFTARKVNQLGHTATETLRQTSEVNHAVNGRGGRRTTIEQDVETIRAKQESDDPSEERSVDRGLVQLVEELLVELKKGNGSR